MKNLNNLLELEQYGISLLTGEADRYSIGRILCDLNEEGCYLVTDYFGLPVEHAFHKNWNSQVNGKPAVASIMLSREALWELGRFALLSVDQFDTVLESLDYFGLRGINHDDRYNAAYLKQAEESTAIKVYRNMAKTAMGPGAGSRNQHVMSGRTV